LSVANSASNYEVYVGGISIVDPAKRYFPVKPVLRPEVTRYRGAYNYESFKLIWDSKINADKWEVVYNDEVDTWYFEVMISEDGKEPTIANRTTSWGAMTVAEVNPSCKNIRVGVRAVAPDGITRSDIAWATNSYEHKYEYQKGIVYESRKLVADEEFTVSLEDPTIPTAHWRLLDENKSVLKEDDGTSFTTSCKNVGLYSIEVSFVDPTPENLNNEYKKLYDGLIQVTPSETGRFPKADFIPSIESVDITDGPKDVTFTFNGIKGEGFASQAVNLSDGTHFFAFDPNIIRKPNTLTMAAWVKSTESIGQVMSLRELGGNPSWGSTWVYIEKNNFTLMGRDRGQDFKDMNSGVEAKIGVWYHIAFTLDRDNKKVCFYINGKKTNEQNVSFKSSYDLYSLGTEGFQGAIDEVQLWDRALTPEEVKVAMYGYKSPNIPANLKGYWVFEETLASNAKKFPNLGTAGDAYPGGCFKGTSLGDKDNLMPKIVGGSSWLSGTLPLKATLKWNFPGATKVNESNPESPVVTYSKEGSYEASLTVTNAWGSSSKKIKVTVLNGTSIINDASTKIVTVFPLPFNDNFNVNVIESGKYTVNVYNETGMLVKKQTQDCVDNECISVDLNAPVGTYMIRILKNNVEVEAVKAVKLK
ncbi:MAG: LamG-like jellyroll fold domain-containing protein, partial [Bacteroidaceae bacterium]